MSDKQYTVYRHIFPNGKCYVGITNGNLIRRWGTKGQGYLLKSEITGSYNQPSMAHAILKYGWENVQHEVLETVSTKEEAEEKEKYYITEVYHSHDIRFGYNICLGGMHPGNIAESTKLKISSMKRGKPAPNKGVPFSEEVRKNMSIAHMGKKPSRETIEKRKQTMKGFRHTEESKQKMREKALGNQNSKGVKRSKEFIEALRLRKTGQVHSNTTKERISEIKRKQKWWTNGKVETMSENCPEEGWVRGRKWKHCQ